MNTPESKIEYAWNGYGRNQTLSEFWSQMLIHAETAVDNSGNPIGDKLTAFMNKYGGYMPEQAFAENITIAYVVPSNQARGHWSSIHFSLYVSKMWVCSRCDAIQYHQHNVKHFSSRRCRAVDLNKDMMDRGMEELRLFVGEQYRNAPLFYGLTPTHINMVAEEYAAAYGKLYQDKVWVTPELNVSIVKWMDGKREGKKMPTLKEHFKADGILPKSEDFKDLKSITATTACCVNGCAVKPSGDGLTISGRVYMMCTKHASHALIGLDKWFEEAK